MDTKVYLPIYEFEDARYYEKDGVSFEISISKDKFVSVYYKGSELYLSVEDLIELSRILEVIGG